VNHWSCPNADIQLAPFYDEIHQRLDIAVRIVKEMRRVGITAATVASRELYRFAANCNP
jgi:hypothetical protein